MRKFKFRSCRIDIIILKNSGKKKIYLTFYPLITILHKVDDCKNDLKF